MFLVLISFICCFLNYALVIFKKILESMFSIRGTGLCVCVKSNRFVTDMKIKGTVKLSVMLHLGDRNEDLI